ncbi:hypothetical protein B0H65DRAFT_577112 [Neurospora tetraspora]|uniref:Uncharacterized protein n=1 Tax=Neurospora tetraspora TaxID=94610 RepID=A0AAE0JDL0_9PEZI|nr:hypothetical protein B0H65DRAFT_577112 [Neurospora tetraspora]
MHPSELLYPGDRALFTFTERPPHSTKQSRWYFGISSHTSDGHTPDLHNPFHPDHQWIIYECIPVQTDQTSSQPAQPLTSFAVHRPINDDRPLSTLNVLLPSSQPPFLGAVTTQIIRDQWQASFHLLCHLDDKLWFWVRDNLVHHFLTGKSIEAEDGIVKDGQDFVKIVLAEGMRDEGIISDEEFDEWWESVYCYYKEYREVKGFEVGRVREREEGVGGDGAGNGVGQRSGERMPGRLGPEGVVVSPVPMILPMPTPRRSGGRVGSGRGRERGGGGEDGVPGSSDGG